MSSTLSPGHHPVDYLTHSMPPSQLTRRTSRSSGSQSGTTRSTRIEKPRSNHNSPRIMERRKTTTATKRYATLDDHYNMMFGISGDVDTLDQPQSQASRPVSWHPSSTQFQVPPRSSVAMEQPIDYSRHYSHSSRNSAHGSDFYSLSTRHSMFSDNAFAQNYSQNIHRGSQDSDVSWQDSSNRTPGYEFSNLSTPATEPMPWYLQEWARKNQEQAANSRNGSTDFLPIQHPPAQDEAVNDDVDMEDSGKELVGMGLYDLPEPSLSWSDGLVERTGKGLKLEETWQPPEEDEDDNNSETPDDEDAGDASSDDGSVEELSQPPPPPPHPANTIQQGVSKPRVQGNMEGQSFFFDEDETYTKEWWFQQLRQPALPVRDAGLGYGWL